MTRAEIVVADASAVVAALRGSGPAREVLRHADIHVPHLLDSEVLAALRRHVASGQLEASAVSPMLGAFGSLALMRHGVHRMSDRIWALRDNVTAYDAAYVALAEAIACPVVTADARLAGAAGPRCLFTVVPG